MRDHRTSWGVVTGSGMHGWALALACGGAIVFAAGDASAAKAKQCGTNNECDVRTRKSCRVIFVSSDPTYCSCYKSDSCSKPCYTRVSRSSGKWKCVARSRDTDTTARILQISADQDAVNFAFDPAELIEILSSEDNGKAAEDGAYVLLTPADKRGEWVATAIDRAVAAALHAQLIGNFDPEVAKLGKDSAVVELKALGGGEAGAEAVSNLAAEFNASRSVLFKTEGRTFEFEAFKVE